MNEEIIETLEVVADTSADGLRLFLTTPFSEYTVTEGLLLFIFLAIVVKIIFDLLRRCF